MTRESEPTPSRESSGGVSRLLFATVARPFRRQTALNCCYLALSVPLGIGYLAFLIGGLSLGLTLSVLLIGVPILLFVLGTSHVFAAFERTLARRLLSVEIAPPRYPFLESDDHLERLRGLAFGLGTYMAICFLATKFVVGLVSLALLAVLLAPAVALVLAPLYYTRAESLADAFGDGSIPLASAVDLPWHAMLVGVEVVAAAVGSVATSLPRAVAVSVVGVFALLVSLRVLNVFARLVGQFSRVFLGSFAVSSGDGTETKTERVR
ncbi:sensor domain-containing protein [Natronolimnohabitans innermongolicus]|uniref:Putative sensor domain-containing protein n=1 Tax=Natronolimnohabitans innermongolicus JCM 12255 TaxID=1227499 RepID=L9X4C8_9EURY|nr:sensor domain-containing protein [Natronolimnohabitans innermongolicus]ELY56634.1 hypothetical protein C493_09680 [Natronolimnohabitans innermongolicus JCM 12255]